MQCHTDLAVQARYLTYWYHRHAAAIADAESRGVEPSRAAVILADQFRRDLERVEQAAREQGARWPAAQPQGGA